MDNKPTPKQLKNLRSLAISMFGPYGALMSDGDVMEFQKKLQAALDKANEDAEKALARLAGEPEVHVTKTPEGFILGGLNNKIV